MDNELEYISDETLGTIVASILKKVKRAQKKVDNNIYTNVVDPFSAVFDAMRQGIGLDKWLEQEKSRKIQKTLQNYIGDFHQNVLGSIPGWENLQLGNAIDLRCTEKRIIAELKNKYNTMNSGAQVSVYDKLQKFLDYGYEGFTAYCVEVVPKDTKPMNLPYHPSERGTQRPSRNDIRLIDGKSFYTLATGDKDALRKLYLHLPIIISRVVKKSHDTFVGSRMFQELFDKVYKD